MNEIQNYKSIIKEGESDIFFQPFFVKANVKCLIVYTIDMETKKIAMETRYLPINP